MNSETHDKDQRIKNPSKSKNVELEGQRIISLLRQNRVFFNGRAINQFIISRTNRPSIIELLCHYQHGISQ